MRKTFRGRIVCQPTPQPIADVSQMHQRRRCHTLLYVAMQILAAPALDRVEEILHMRTSIARRSLPGLAGLSFRPQENLVAEVIDGKIALLAKKDVADEIRAAGLDGRFASGWKTADLEY